MHFSLTHALAVLLPTATPAWAQQAAPVPPPTCAAHGESSRFDFWVGEWTVTTADGTHVGDSSVRKILGDCVVFENWRSAQGIEGKSLNAYNAALGVWQQFWVSQTGTVTEFRESRWVGASLEFTAHSGAPGAERLQRLTFTPVDGNTVRQHGEASADGGATWRTTYDFYYHRK